MLTPGSTHPLVKILQSYLKVLGYYPIDKETNEVFDNQDTQRAVERFKEAAALRNQDGAIDASVDDQTWTELIKRADAVFPPVRTIQQAVDTAVTTAIAQANLSGKVGDAINQANLSEKLDNAITQANIPDKVSNAIGQADIPQAVRTAIEQADISRQANAEVTNAINQASIPGKVNDAVNQANIPGKIGEAVTQANIPQAATDAVNGAVAQANISGAVNNAITQANISGAVNTAITQANIPSTANTAVDTAIRQADISTRVSNAIRQADIPTKVNDAVTQADISSIARNAVSTAVTQANISNAVNTAITQANIPQVASTAVNTAITQANIPKKVSDAIEPAKREVDTAAATTKATAIAMQTFSIHRDAIEAYKAVKQIADEIQSLTNTANKDASEAQVKLPKTLAENARDAAVNAQAVNTKAQTELKRARDLLDFAKTRAENAQAEANQTNITDTNVTNAENAKNHAQTALNEIWVITGKNYPEANINNLPSEFHDLFRREFSALPSLKTDVENYAEAARKGLDTVKTSPVSTEAEDFLAELFLSVTPPSLSPVQPSKNDHDEYLEGILYYFELENPPQPGSENPAPKPESSSPPEPENPSSESSDAATPSASSVSS